MCSFTFGSFLFRAGLPFLIRGKMDLSVSRHSVTGDRHSSHWRARLLEMGREFERKHFYFDQKISF